MQCRCGQNTIETAVMDSHWLVYGEPGSNLRIERAPIRFSIFGRRYFLLWSANTTEMVYWI